MVGASIEVFTCMMMMNRVLYERDNIVDLHKAIERIMDTNGCFGGKDVFIYIEAYTMEMQMRDIPITRQLSSFARVVTLGLH